MRRGRPTLQPTQRARGFTLVEMLIVISVLGVAGALVIPFMGDLTEFRTEAAVRRIVSDMTFAQSEAMARQSGRRVQFDADGKGYRLLSTPYDPDTDVLYDPTAVNAEGRYIIDFNHDPRFEGVAITAFEFDGANAFITFDELGGPIAPDGTVSAGGRVEIQGPDGRYELLLAAFTGRISVNRLE